MWHVDLDVDMAIDMVVDVVDDVDVDTPYFHGPVSNGPNNFSLLII
jgi:hypothetical protein